MDIRPLTPDHVPPAYRLSTQVGWNQTETDWRRLLELSPRGCFGGWVNGELIATGTLITYGETVGWIGMILVDENHRRQGYGSSMFERVHDLAVDRCDRVGLDATEAGRTVYRQLGYVDVTTVERWSGSLVTAESPLGEVYDLKPADNNELFQLDHRTCGVDRTALLDHLLTSEGCSGFAIGEPIRGYAIVRPGRQQEHIGPVIAGSNEDLSLLLSAAARDLEDNDVLIDLIDPESIGPLLEPLGFQHQRTLTRMSFEDPLDLLVGESVVAAAAFELG